MNWATTKARLLRAMREGSDGSCKIVVLLKSGQRIAGTVGYDAPPSTWETDELQITSKSRTEVTVHIIDLAEVAVISVVGP